MSVGSPTGTSCERWQEAISALADGEDAGIDARLVAAHVARCAPCAAFEERCRSGRGLVGAAPEMPDVSRGVVRSARRADRDSRTWWVRPILAVVAIEILVVSVPSLLAVSAEGGAAHDARHLGAFSAAYAVGLLVVVARPARARTMLPVSIVLAAALVITAVVDLVQGRVPLVSEARHLPEVLSVPLTWLLAVPRTGRPAAGPSAGATLRPVDTDDAP